MIRLCTVMRQLHEDSISQALYVADELLQMSCTPRDSANATVVGEHTQPSHLFCTWQRGGSRKGIRIKKGGSVLRGPGPQSGRPGSPSYSLPFGPQHRAGVQRGPGDRKDMSAPAFFLQVCCPVVQDLDARVTLPPLASNPEGQNFRGLTLADARIATSGKA